MSSKILVTGATGTMGKALIEKLVSKEIPFVAAVRNVETAKKQLGTDHVVYFDFADQSSYENALEGVDKVFLLGPPFNLEIVDLLGPFIDFLKAKNINRVVYLSALGQEVKKNLPWHAAIGEKLHNDDFDYTILKPSVFAQNFKTYASGMITEQNVIFVTAGDGKIGFVDVNDVAEVAVTVFMEDTHGKQTYSLTGPEALTFYDAADILSELLGKTIYYPNPSNEEFTVALTAAGIPDMEIQYMIRAYAMMKNNNTDIVNDEIERLIGKKPTSLREVFTQDFTV